MTIINTKPLILIGCSFILLACAKPPQPPALPEEPIVLEAFLGPSDTDNADIRECQSPEWRYARGKKRPKIPTQNMTIERDIPPAAAFSPIESTNSPILSPKKSRIIPPEQLITRANTDARVSPTGTGYFGGRAIYRYQYNPGKIYDVYVNTSTVTRVYFPPGEKIATNPTLNPDQWAPPGSASIGKEGAEVDVLLLRPLENATTVDMAVDMESGRNYFLHLVPSKNAMLGVTWDLGILQEVRESENKALKISGTSLDTAQGEKVYCRPNQGDKSGMFMPIELAQLHTGYRIEVKGGAGFIPTQVFDDGRRTLIRLRALSGNAPAVFVYKPDGSRGLTQFAPYYIPNDPARGLYLVVESVWPVLELVGNDGQAILITRVTDQVRVAEPWKKP